MIWRRCQAAVGGQHVILVDKFCVLNTDGELLIGSPAVEQVLLALESFPPELRAIFLVGHYDALMIGRVGTCLNI